MATCHICLDDLKKPVALPCGHIFCGECIFKTVQSVQPYSHLHACPMCRTLFNIAPVNMNLVPPNLRAFITPSVRRVYLDTPDRPATTPEKAAGKGTDATPSTSVASSSQASEISRLQAENVALRTSCAMWRRRAELHGSANLGLLNFAKMVRDQASNLAREREELQNCCLLLKRRLDEIESVTASKRAAPSQSESLSTRPLKGLPSRCPSKHSHRASLTSPSAATSSAVLEPSRKRIKTEHDSSPTYLTDGSLGVTGRAMLLPHLPVAHHRPSS